MGKKKKRTKFEKSIDHRNVGFTAVDALFEHNSEAAKNINRQIVTKEGLKMYSDKELEEKGGEVIEYNYNSRYSWEDFKAMPAINKREYIAHLRKKYEGVCLRDFAEMFCVSRNSVGSEFKKIKVGFPNGRVALTEGRKQFKKDMVTADFAEAPVFDPHTLPEKVDLVPEVVDVPAEIEVVVPTWSVQKVSLVCDAAFVSEALATIGFSGRVTITAEQML